MCGSRVARIRGRVSEFEYALRSRAPQPTPPRVRASESSRPEPLPSSPISPPLPSLPPPPPPLLLSSRWMQSTAPNACPGARAYSLHFLRTQSTRSSRALGMFKRGRSASGTWFGFYNRLVAIECSHARLNTKLEANGYPPMSSLVRDLSDGVRLIQLMVSTVLVQCPGLYAHAAQSPGNYGCDFRFTLPIHGSQPRLGDTSLGRYNKAPRMRIQKAENVNKALEFITSRGVKLTNIGPEGQNLPFLCLRSFRRGLQTLSTGT